MASITLNEALKFSNSAIGERVSFDTPVLSQLPLLLDFEYVEGGSTYDINLADGSALASHAVAGSGSAPPTTLPTISTRQNAMTYFASLLEVDSLILGHYGNHRDILRSLLTVKATAVLHSFFSAIFDGADGMSGTFKGLHKTADDNSNVVEADNGAADGGAVQVGELEETAALLSASAGDLRNRYFVMHTDAYAHLYRGAYQGQIQFTKGPLGMTPVVSGVPILLDNFIRTDRSHGVGVNLTTIYAVILGRAGITGVMPCASRGKEVRVRGPLLKEATDTEFYQLSMGAGLAYYNVDGVAMLDHVDASL